MVSLASVSDALNVWKYESSNLELTSSFTSPTGRCSCLAWNHTNQVVATGGANPQIHLIQANNGSILSSLQVAQDGSANVRTNSVALSSNSRFLGASLSNTVQIWDLKRRLIKAVMTDHRHPVSALCFLPSGEVVSGDGGGVVRIWDAKAFTSSPELIAPSGTLSVAGVTSLSISPSGGSALAVGYTDGTLRVWDSVTYSNTRSQVCHSGSLTALAYSPRNPRLVTTAGSDGKVTLIDTGAKNSTDPSAVIEIPGVSATSVSFHEDAIHTAIGLSNGRILIYDWRNLRKPVVSTAPREGCPILSLAFQVPKTTASGGNSSVAGSNASSRQPRTAAAPAISSPAPSVVSAAEPAAVPKPAPAPSTDVPVKVPSTPPRTQSATIAASRPEAVASPVPVVARPQLPTPAAAVVASVDASLRSPETSFSRSRGPTFQEDGGSLPPTRTPLKVAPTVSQSSAYLPESAGKSNSAVKASQPVVSSRDYGEHPPADAAGQSSSHYTSMSSLPAPPPVTATATSSSSARKAARPLPTEWAQQMEGSFTTQEDPRRLESRADERHSQEHTVRRSHPPPEAAAAGDLLDESFGSVRQAVRPVTARDLEDALALLKYDMHREMQDIIREQIRQFSISKDETALLLKETNAQLADLLQANKELRAENERLRRIY